MKSTNFLKRIWVDLKRKEFIPLKILYFMVYGGMFTLLPFLTIHARSLGIKENEIGTILGILPILFVIASSGIGIMADKIGNFKKLLAIAMASMGLTSLLFLTVPVARINHQMPDLLPLQVNCLTNENANITLTTPYTCDYIPSKTYSAYIMDCKYNCYTERNTSMDVWESVDFYLCSLTNDCLYSKAVSESEDFGIVDKTKESYNNTQDHFPIELKLIANEGVNLIESVNSFCSVISKNLTDDLKYNTDLNEKETQNTCWTECKAQVVRKEMCSNDVTIEEINPKLTIGIYVLIRVLHALSLVLALPLFEGATLAVLKERKGDIGLQKMYSNLGMVILTPLSGAMIDAFSSVEGTNFRPAFYLYCITNISSALCILLIDLQFKEPAKRITKELKSLLTNFEIVTFIIIGFIVGVANGVIDTFLFWILENMGASRSLMGLTVTVGSSFGIIIMIFATPIIERLGHVNTLIFGIVFFVIRLLGYSFIQNPWLAMPFEAMECFTTALFGVAQVSYVASLSTSTTIVTLQTLSMGILHGVGRGTGGMFGGFLAKAVGLREAFQITALICGCTAATYFTLNIFFFKQTQIERQNQKDNMKFGNEYEIKNDEIKNKDLDVEGEKAEK